MPLDALAEQNKSSPEHCCNIGLLIYVLLAKVLARASSKVFSSKTAPNLQPQAVSHKDRAIQTLLKGLTYPQHLTVLLSSRFKPSIFL